MTTIQVVGHVCVDLTPGLWAAGVAAPGELVGVGPLEITVGGAVGNCGRVLAELGIDVALSGSVGDDVLGTVCREVLGARPHTAVDLAVAPGMATSYSVVVEPLGVDRSFWHHTGANDAFSGDCPITAARLLHYGYPSLTPGMCVHAGDPIRALFERAHRRGVATSLDLAYLPAASPLRTLDWEALLRNALAACDVFCPSWDDVASCLDLPADADDEVVSSWAAESLGWGCAMVLVTLGRRGSYLRVASRERLAGLASCGLDPEAWADRELWVAPPVVEHVVTTNAAGDTFKAAFLAGVVNGGSPAQCLDLARQVVARHLGGLPLGDVQIELP